MTHNNGLTLVEIEELFSRVWAAPAVAVPYRICGNRYKWAVTDHGENWIPLRKTAPLIANRYEPNIDAWLEMEAEK